MDNGKWKTGETGKQETEKPETGQMDWTYLQRLTILQMAPVARGSRNEEYDTDGSGDACGSDNEAECRRFEEEDAGKRDYREHQNDNRRLPFGRNPSSFPVASQVRAEQAGRLKSGMERRRTADEKPRSEQQKRRCRQTRQYDSRQGKKSADRSAPDIQCFTYAFAHQISLT